MKTVVDRAESRGHASHGWLDTYHTFSFANYYNNQRMGFGQLRVLNDDLVKPLRGFELHPHANMEVVSIPISGSLRHADSAGGAAVISVGDIQTITAGSGVSHSEHNNSDSEDVEFLQIWVFPREQDLAPSYKDVDVREVQKHNELNTIVAPDGSAPGMIAQDAWFMKGTLDKDVSKEYKLRGKDTGVYVFVIEGKVEVDGVTLDRRDGAGFWETDKLNLKTLEDSHVLLMEVPMQAGEF